MDTTNKNTSRFKQWVIRMHNKYSHITRSGILGTRIAEIIKSEFDCSQKIEALDFGCGDMNISVTINQLIPETVFTGTDIHLIPENAKLPFPYIQFRNNRLPFENNRFKIVILCDVLHHIPEKDQAVTMKECLRVGENVIMKDVFEKGLFSRLVLIMLDILGNWAYGVRIPNRYFTRKRFLKFCEENGFTSKIMINQIELYNHMPYLLRQFSNPNLNFITVIRKKEDETL